MGPIVGFDFTWSKTVAPSQEKICSTLEEWCKKWVFQEEKGEGGLEHYQGRVHLIKAARLDALISKTKEAFKGVHWSITSNNTHQANSFNYVMKADTRVAGPWSNETYEAPPVLTKQLEHFMTLKLYPWQKQVLEIAKTYDERKITFILDTEGNAGKSVFCEYLEYNRLAYEMPPFKLMEDIMACAMCLSPQTCYIVDMPRAMKKDKLGEFYAGLECLKNGVMYDKRYNFKKRRINRPQVIVFGNVAPTKAFLSADRWNCYSMFKHHLINFILKD